MAKVVRIDAAIIQALGCVEVRRDEARMVDRNGWCDRKGLVGNLLSNSAMYVW
jgi:hypothetical protein